jgi:competence protein ComEC
MFSWSNIPLVRLVVPFAIGILLSSLLLKESSLFSLLIITSVIALVCAIIILRKFNYKQRWLYGFSVYLTFIALGMIHQNTWQQATVIELPTEKTLQWVGRVEEVSYRGDTASLLKVQVNAVKHEHTFKQKQFGVTAYLSSAQKLQVGDWISANSFLKPIEKPLNPYQFDYASFMQKRGYLRSTYLEEVQHFGRQLNLQAYTATLRKSLIDGFEKSGIEGEELAVLNAISLGDKSLLNQETRNAYAGAGAMHILAVSGLHVGIVYLIFSQLLFFLNKLSWQRWLKALLLLLVIWGFAILTGLSPSVQRAGCMFSFIIVANALNRYTSTLNSIAAAAFILMLVNPMILFELGFQLSFAAVIGIVTMHSTIYAIWQPRFLLLDKAWSLIVVSITAQLATLPFVLYYFHQFPNWFLLTNLFVIPLAFLIVSGAILVGCCILFLQSDFFLAEVLNGFLKLLNYGIQAMESLPYFTSSDIWITPIQAILLGIMVVAFMLFVNHRKFFQLFTALACVTLFFTISVAKKQKERKQSYIGVYALKDDPAYVFRKGQKAVVLIPKGIAPYGKQIIVDHLNAENVRAMRFTESVEDLVDNSLFKMKELNGNLLLEHQQELYYFDLGYEPPSEKILDQIDCLIVEEKHTLEKLLDREKLPKVIAASSIPLWWAEKQKGFDFHAVMQSAYWQSN